jgi:tricarballylate dehydrogenase
MTTADLGRVDVLVIGAGNAAANAALQAREMGATVAMLETAPQEARGGNSAFTGGAFRFTYRTIEDLIALAPDISDLDLVNIDFGSYTSDQYYDDMHRLTEYRCDPELTDVLIASSYAAALWLKKVGVRFQPALGRQAFKVGGRFKFWGGLACHLLGGGAQLVKTLHEAIEKAGIKVLYDTTAVGLIYEAGRVQGVRARRGAEDLELRAKAVVLACGGFESNPEMRARYLGPNWDLVKVRGTRFNNGWGHRMAIELGAATHGHWSGAHAVQWDVNAPPYGDLSVGDRFQKHNYPFGIIVNARGERFLDEGADFHSYTYAKYGQEVLKQPGLFAWQVFDQKIVGLLREEYRISRITRETANTFEELAPKLTGVDAKGFLHTVREFNAAPRPQVPFNPNIHDGLCTGGLAINKSNWANTLDAPPYHAYGVTTGITFTFGGLRVSAKAEVQNTAQAPIRGLYAAGEIVGGLYYHNYASGTGLVAGVVFGCIAGREAATFADCVPD